MELKENTEIVGKLSDIEVKDNKIILQFSLIKIVEVPTDRFIHNDLKKFVGKKIGVLCIDGAIRIRKINPKLKKN
jgi:hypothetical protein